MSKEKKNMVVPKLRFPEFREAGEWRFEPCEKIYSFKVTNSFSRDDLNYVEGTVKNIHYGDIHTKFSILFDIRKETVPYVNPSISIEKIRPESYCAEGDIIFADASEDLNDVGKSIEIIALNNEKLLAGMHTLLARQKESELIVGFGGHLFKSDGIRSQIKKAAQGTKVLGISAGRLLNINLCYPKNKSEQQKIATCLTSLDVLITAQSEKIKALQTHKKGLMQQSFPAEGETVPRVRFGEFEGTGEWETGSLGDKTSKVGSGITPNGGDKNYKSKGRPFVRSQNVGWGQLILEDIAFIDEATHSTFSATEIKKGDVLLNITGASIGRSTIADLRIEGGNVNQHVCIIRTNQNKLSPIFLNQYLLSDGGQYQIDSFQAGGNRQGLNFAQIRSFSLLLPPQISEQQKIAACLSSLDDLITAQSQKLEALKTQKRGLMQQLFPNPNET